jgi:hypothetical protein
MRKKVVYRILRNRGYRRIESENGRYKRFYNTKIDNTVQKQGGAEEMRIQMKRSWTKIQKGRGYI